MRFVVEDVNQQVIDEFRHRGGKVGGPLAGQQLLLLTHQGATTGTIRTTPLGWFDDAGTPVVFASNAGAKKHPQWYVNLLARPDVVVEIGTTQLPAVARVVEGDERESLWLRVIHEKPFLVAHQESTGGRIIPLIRLEEL